MKTARRTTPLLERRAAADPIRQFRAWFRQARSHPDVNYPEVMFLSNIDARGWPDARAVLLKHADARGFVFFTNLRSPKGRMLLKRPRASLAFYWEPLRREVRIQGTAARVTDGEADAYFKTRPRMSQLSAWASKQSEVVTSRAALDRAFAAAERRFRGKRVPRPPYWSGFRVKPTRIEFWQERPNRMHDRLLYTRRPRGWRMQRLSP